MPQQIAAILFDLGDTIMIEESEVKDADDTTLRADLIPGMAQALRQLKARGYRLGLVTDSRPETPPNVLRQHGLLDLFDTLAISDVVGAVKPDPRIFRAALEAMHIAPGDHGRVVMVGNHLERDVVGANRLGLISVFFHWNGRRGTRPLTAEQQPRYRVTSAQQLTALIERLEETGLSPEPQPDAERNDLT